MHSRIFALFVSVAFLLVDVADSATAGTTGALVGRVTDQIDHRPLGGATITIASPSQQSTTTSDANGTFRFLALAPDTYTLSVEVRGYEAVSRSGVTVLADQSLTLAVDTQRALKTIGRTVARNSSDLVKPGTTADVYSLSGATADQAHALAGPGGLDSSYGAIASVPGSVVQGGQQGWFQSVSIRGGDIDQVGYELDGVPVNAAYTNAPQSMLSSLGEQELQVYTGGVSAAADGQGLSGYVNQVIRVGTSPGFSDVTAGIGAPSLYNKLALEVGGATRNRNFTYYLGSSLASQDYRYIDQFNGASDPHFVYPLQWPGRFNLYDGSPNADGSPSSPLFSPGQTYGIASSHQADTIANFHFALPHKRRDSLRDDLQLLYISSELVSRFYSSIDDQGGASAVAPALIGTPGTYADGFVYTGPTFAPPLAALVKPALFPSSPSKRPYLSGGLLSTRDDTDNGLQVFKLQYQKNINSRSFARVLGYSMYSNWFLYGPANQQFTNYYGAEVNDFEIGQNTYGLSALYSNQLSDKHLLTASGNYNEANSRRSYSYNYPSNQPISTPFTNYIDVRSASGTGNCFSPITGRFSSCFASTDIVGNPTRGTFADPTQATALAGASLATSFAAAGAAPSWIATENGPQARLNDVKPYTASISLNDGWMPSDRLTFNFGLRLERFTDKVPGTSSGPNRDFWVAAFNHENCYKPGTYGTVNVAQAGASPAATGVFATASNCTQFAGPGYLPANFVNTVGNGIIGSTVFEPRASFSYSLARDSVVRGSFGIYSRPVNAEWIYYNTAGDRDFAVYNGSNFLGYGYNTPLHDLQPDRSYNYDFSLEQRIPHTDVALKVTPYYRRTQNQLQAFPIGVGGIISGFNVGEQASQGVELAVTKGNFGSDGVSAQLSYTYTHSRIKYNALPSGTNVIDSLNQYVQEYNSYTAACAGTITNANARLCGLPVGNQNAHALPTFPARDASNGSIVQAANPYFASPAQALMNPNGSYTTYDQIPQAFVGANGYETPNVATLIVQYKRHGFSIAPSATYTSGSFYGSPLTYPGYVPTGCNVKPGTTIIVPYTCTGTSASTGGNYLMIPNAFTGTFDGLGTYRQPARLTLNVNVGYQFTKRVRLSLSLLNLMDKCYQRGYRWDDANTCVYSELPSGGAAVGPSGNFLPPSQTPVALRYPYAAWNNNLNTGFLGVRLPPQAALQLKVAL